MRSSLKWKINIITGPPRWCRGRQRWGQFTHVRKHGTWGQTILGRLLQCDRVWGQIPWWGRVKVDIQISNSRICLTALIVSSSQDRKSVAGSGNDSTWPRGSKRGERGAEDWGMDGECQRWPARWANMTEHCASDVRSKLRVASHGRIFGSITHRRKA